MKTCTVRGAAAMLCAFSIPVQSAAADSAVPTDLLDAVEVEGKALPPAVTIIEADQFPPGRETGDALRDVLGVSGSRIGGHGTDVFVRGQSQNRVNVLLDGAYVHGGCPNRMDPPTAYASTGNYESVVVIRGSQTLEYGGGGSGGTILFDRVTERFGAEEDVRGQAGLGYRGNGDIGQADIDIAAGNSDFFARAIGAYTDAGNYEDGGGNEVRSAYTEYGGTVILGYTPTDSTRAELSYEQQQTRDALFPGAGMDSPESDNEVIRFKYDTQETAGDLSRVRFEAYNSDVDHVMDNYTLRPLTAPFRMRAPSTSNTAGGRLVAELQTAVGQWKLGVDGQYSDRNADRINDTTGNLNSVLWPGVEINQTGAFAELVHDLDPSNRLTGGLRYDYVTSDASRADVNPPGMAMSPNQLYAIYYDGAQASKKTDHNIGGLLRYEHDLSNANGTVYASFSRAVRTPDATERFLGSNGMMPSRRWVGNPDIESEKHHQVELGIAMRGTAWDVTASIFYNDVTDYILRDRFTQTGNNATIYRNIDATLMGGEATVGYNLSPSWRAEFGLAYVRADNDTDDRPIAQTPPLEGIASLEYADHQWRAGARVRAAAEQTRVDTTSSSGIEGQGLDVGQTPGWGVLDLYASYEISDAVSLDVGIDNVFDKEYAQHLNRANAFDPVQVQVNEPGRSAWVKLSAYF